MLRADGTSHPHGGDHLPQKSAESRTSYARGGEEGGDFTPLNSPPTALRAGGRRKRLVPLSYYPFGRPTRAGAKVSVTDRFLADRRTSHARGGEGLWINLTRRTRPMPDRRTPYARGGEGVRFSRRREISMDALRARGRRAGTFEAQNYFK